MNPLDPRTSLGLHLTGQGLLLTTQSILRGGRVLGCGGGCGGGGGGGGGVGLCDRIICLFD